MVRPTPNELPHGELWINLELVRSGEFPFSEDKELLYRLYNLSKNNSKSINIEDEKTILSIKLLEALDVSRIKSARFPFARKADHLGLL